MEAQLGSYEEAKRTIRTKMASQRRMTADVDDVDPDLFDDSGRQVGFSDMAQIGAKVVIGAGLGLLAGVATIAAVASAAEVVLAGAVTKVAGVVGGAAGLSMGIRRMKNEKRSRA
ncbi:MAG: hypothetical protein JSV60_10365 [Desulfobacterales bacterium]|nr:MAG: hypothetical protein JSV60_10365 [Desulfobacterales bacterium]